MPHPGLPFGKYTMCVGSRTNSWEGTFENNSINGPTTAGVLTPPNNGGYEEPVLGGPNTGSSISASKAPEQLGPACRPPGQLLMSPLELHPLPSAR